MGHVPVGSQVLLPADTITADTRILAYHTIAPTHGQAGRYRVSPEMFRAHMQYIADEGFAVVSLEQLVN